jgi:hypothetical protein
MRRFAVLSPAVFLFLTFVIIGPHEFDGCLPKGIKRTDVVSTQPAGPGKALKKTTSIQKLAELKASCRQGRLVDAAGKEIRFFRLEGCWGNPPEGYQEILRKQNEELARLRERYTVIEMTCNPDGVPQH